MITVMDFDGEKLKLLDQTKLPNETVYVELTTPEQVAHAIASMQVRGAPCIGVAAGYGMALAALEAPVEDERGFFEHLSNKARLIAEARPTAVNLEWAVRRVWNIAVSHAGEGAHNVQEAILAEARYIHREDSMINRAIGENLLTLLKPNMGVLTHCNAGALAATDYGTATSPFYLAKERGIPLTIYADETRPRLQGASLTAYELFNAGMDVTLICDNMAAVLMREGKIDAVITGCDRVAANGDAANKIGTFGVSVLCRHFGIPMYIAAPTPTIDMACKTGADIPIEERDGDEIRKIAGTYIAPAGVKVYNPSFDVTPAEHIAAIVTERGIARPPYTESLLKLMDEEHSNGEQQQNV